MDRAASGSDYGNRQAKSARDNYTPTPSGRVTTAFLNGVNYRDNTSTKMATPAKERSETSTWKKVGSAAASSAGTIALAVVIGGLGALLASKTGATINDDDD